MATEKEIDLVNLDFDSCKENLKNFLSNDQRLSDFNFDGSNISILLDLMTLVDLRSSHKAHIALNEVNLETAQLRKNVVAKGKNFAYIPQSYISSKAIIKIVITPTSTELLTAPTSIFIPKGTIFKGYSQSETFNFLTLTDYTANLVNDQYTFEEITIYQGNLKTISFRVDANLISQDFIIPDEDVDISTLNVYVKNNDQEVTKEIYKRFTEFSNIDSESQIYFINENAFGNYYVRFGDGFIGKKLLTNNIVELEYVYTRNVFGNGVESFTLDSNISSFNDTVLTTVSPSSGGSERESIENIKRNANSFFASQNRCVTNEDYKAIISSIYTNIRTISVWGGQENVPKQPGKVFICIKPLDQEVLSETDKIFIKDSIKNKTMGVEQVFVEPDYTYLRLESFFKYNPLRTNLSKNELERKVKENILVYKDNDLEKFEGIFRNSNVLRLIENSDPSILSSFNNVLMLKYFDTITTTGFYKTFNFPTPIYNFKGNYKIFKTSNLIINSENYFITDVYSSTETTKRKLSLYKIASPNNILVKEDVGYVDFQNNRAVLYGFQTDNVQEIKITVIPDTDDIVPKRNQLLSIREEEIFVSGEIDTISTQGTAGADNYVHFSKTKGLI